MDTEGSREVKTHERQTGLRGLLGGVRPANSDFTSGASGADLLGTWEYMCSVRNRLFDTLLWILVFRAQVYRIHGKPRWNSSHDVNRGDYETDIHGIARAKWLSAWGLVIKPPLWRTEKSHARFLRWTEHDHRVWKSTCLRVMCAQNIKHCQETWHVVVMTCLSNCWKCDLYLLPSYFSFSSNDVWNTV